MSVNHAPEADHSDKLTNSLWRALIASSGPRQAHEPFDLTSLDAPHLRDPLILLFPVSDDQWVLRVEDLSSDLFIEIGIKPRSPQDGRTDS